MRLLVASDKFKGTATSAEIGAAAARAAAAAGVECVVLPLSDGGDGLLEVFGGGNRETEVTGPLGIPVAASWRLDSAEAVIESARASGLTLAGGRENSDPMAATSAGTGELIEAAVAAGARRVLVGLGGSACTDGGLGAVAALSATTLRDLASGRVELAVCCDVTTRYVDAAPVFGPQKGAGPGQIERLTARLVAAQETLRGRFGVDVGELPGAGAAGGLAGGLAAAGGRLRPGFDLIAERAGLATECARADLVVTGEGCLDATSFDGKVVGGVMRAAAAAGTRMVAVVGTIEPGTDSRELQVISLVERFGPQAANDDVLGCVEHAVGELLGPETDQAR